MLTKVAAKRIVDWLVKNGGVEDGERIAYEFGLDKLFSSLINILFALIFGLLLGVPLQAIVFYLAYASLRIYAGGYHAEKPLNCLLAGVLVLIPCFVAIRFYQAWNLPIIFWGLLCLCVLFLFVSAPVEHKNKPLDDVEKVVYRHRMLRNLAIVVIGAIKLEIFSLDSFAVAVLLGIILSTAMAIIGKFGAKPIKSK